MHHLQLVFIVVVAAIIVHGSSGVVDCESG